MSDDEFQAACAHEVSALAETLEPCGINDVETPDGRARAELFRSPLGAELVIWRSSPANQLLQAQLSVRGEIAQWDAPNGPRTGLIVESDGGGEELVRFDDAPVARTLARAAAILRAIPGIPNDARGELARRFEVARQAPPAPAAKKSWFQRLFRGV